ncbi:MAG: phosphatase PAP2 family protein [Omnitrophica WOR_2 bacterium]
MANREVQKSLEESLAQLSKNKLPHISRKDRRKILVISLAIGLILVLILIPPHTLASLVRGLIEQRLLFGLWMLFNLVMLSLLFSGGQAIDAWVFLRFNLHGPRPRWLDTLMWVITQIGNVFFAWALASIFYILGMHRLAVEIILGMITLWMVVEVAKTITDRARPYAILLQTRIIGWREPGLSFPSGHTSQTFFLISLLKFHFQLGHAGTIALFGIALVVGITRMYVGAHYPRDVLAGALLGTVWGILTNLVDGYLIGHPL